MIVVGMLENRSLGYLQLTLAPALDSRDCDNHLRDQCLRIVLDANTPNIGVRDEVDGLSWSSRDPMIEPEQLVRWEGVDPSPHPENMK